MMKFTNVNNNWEKTEQINFVSLYSKYRYCAHAIARILIDALGKWLYKASPYKICLFLKKHSTLRIDS